MNRNNESADNQAVSESAVYTIYINDIEDIKDKYINIKNNSSSTSNKKKLSGESFSEEDEKSFFKKKNKEKITPAIAQSSRHRGQSAEEAKMTTRAKIKRSRFLFG